MKDRRNRRTIKVVETELTVRKIHTREIDTDDDYGGFSSDPGSELIILDLGKGSPDRCDLLMRGIFGSDLTLAVILTTRRSKHAGQVWSADARIVDSSRLLRLKHAIGQMDDR